MEDVPPEVEQVIDRNIPVISEEVFWIIPCSTYKLKNKGDVIASHITHSNGYEAIDIRVRRNTAHEMGPGFSKQGVRLRMEEAVSLWKALGKVLTFIDEEE